MLYVPLEKILLYSRTIDENFNDCENTYSPSQEVVSIEDILECAKKEGVEL